MSRGRALRTGIAWDMRTGMKIRGRKLVSDGERPGIWTERSWADQRHPQRFVNVPPPDGLSYRPGPPPMHAIGAIIEMSWVMASDTSFDLTTDGTTMQRYEVLRRLAAPSCFASINPAAISVAQGSPDTDHDWLASWVVPLGL
jgi:hypothetical protein